MRLSLHYHCLWRGLENKWALPQRKCPNQQVLTCSRDVAFLSPATREYLLVLLRYTRGPQDQPWSLHPVPPSTPAPQAKQEL